jgi:hypothetical protein
MVCQYSRPGPVSSEKHEGTPGPEVEGRGGPPRVVETGMVVSVCDDSQLERLSVRSLRSKPKKSLALRTLWRLYVDDTLLKQMLHHFQDVAAGSRPCIQQAHPLAAPDPPHSGDRVRWGAKRPRGDQGGAGAGAAGDAREARRLKGFGEAHRGQDGGPPARQPRLPHPRWTEEDVGVTMPA